MLNALLRFGLTVAALAVLAGTAAAQPADKRTLFTFSGPVAIPGQTLPAGQYIFRLVSLTDGRVVQVLSADGTKSHAIFFAMANERPTPADKPEVRFMETASGMPAALKTWWYPGDRRGYEFVYPKDQARTLAKGVSQPVLTTQANTTETSQTNTPNLTRISAGGQQTNVSGNAAPAVAAPSGTSQQGELASPSIPITDPEVPTPAK